MKFSPDKMMCTIEERVDQKAAHWLQSMTKLKKSTKPLNQLTLDEVAQKAVYDKFRDIIRESSSASTDEDIEKLINKLRGFLYSTVGRPSVDRSYRFATGKKCGRMFNFKGIQSLQKLFRGALCGSMTDVDFANCHPTILLWLCKEYDIPCPQLQHFINNRDDTYADLMRVTGRDRDACKMSFLSAINENKPSAQRPKSKGLVDFEIEMIEVQKSLVQFLNFPSLRLSQKKRWPKI